MDVKLKELRIRVHSGLGKLLPNHVLSTKIKARKKKGLPITYTEHHVLTTARDDFWKGLRMLLTLGYSREFFLYSYLVGPLLGNSPKAWAAWPSTFDLQRDKKLRDRSLNEKRVVAVGKIIGEVTDETNPENEQKVQERGQKNIEIVNKALKCKDPFTCLDVMGNYILTEKKHASKVYLKNCNGAIVKGILTAVGGGPGLPNIPLINRLNCNEIANILDKIGKSDDVLSALDSTQSLSDREVMMACRERGISATYPANGRADLSQWLSTIKQPIEGNSAQRFENMQNKRLVLMGWYIARDCKTSGSSTLYRSIAGL